MPNPMEADQARADSQHVDTTKLRGWDSDECKCESICETCDHCTFLLERDPSDR